MLDENSVSWRYAGDVRTLPFLGRAFLLQAAHPTIGAGVGEHSTFKQDPFGRFHDSYGLVLRTLYAPDGEQVGAEVRESHKVIKGTKSDGSHYHAYEPEAYFWVLATGHETLVTTAERFGRPMSPGEERGAYEEMRELGRRFGLRDRDMPATVEEFDEWYAWMLAERIENNDTVRDVLETVRRPPPPKGFPSLLWPLPREPLARLSWLATVGTLSPEVRERLGIPWSRLDEAQLAIVVRTFKSLEILPESWFYLPIAREAFERARAGSARSLDRPGEEALAA